MNKIDVEKITSLLKRYPFIVSAYQYGSTVRGQEGPLSDLDIAILVDEDQTPSGVELLRTELLLAYELQKRLDIPKVDLITFNQQRLSMQHAVLRTGKLIYDGNPKYRIRFTQMVIEAYLDFQPTLRLIDRFHTKGRLKRCGVR
jgi:predicted nucleotidyltransferase